MYNLHLGVTDLKINFNVKKNSKVRLNFYSLCIINATQYNIFEPIVYYSFDKKCFLFYIPHPVILKNQTAILTFLLFEYILQK